MSAPTDRRHQRGFTIFELLVAGALAIITATLVVTAYSANRIQHANECQTDLIAMLQMESHWVQSVASGNPDMALCTQINTRVIQYNTTCGEDFGTVTALKCPYR